MCSIVGNQSDTWNKQLDSPFTFNPYGMVMKAEPLTPPSQSVFFAPL